MKYQTIGTRLLGYLSPNTNVVIKLVDIKQDKLIQLLTDVCLESTALPGLYIFDTNNIDLDKIDNIYKTSDTSLEIAYIMTNELNQTYGGKIVIDNDLKLLNIINNNINQIPTNVWNLLSEDEQQTYKDILRRIYQNTDMIPILM